MTSDPKFKIPNIKKKISSYVLGEEGKISKQSLITLGAVLGTAALGGMLSAKDVAAGHTNAYQHWNNLYLQYSGGAVTGTHSHHSSHQSHNSHASHSSY